MEQSYAVIAVDGIHSWVGKHFAPTEDELQLMHDTLIKRQLAADLYQVIGAYWSNQPLTFKHIKAIGLVHSGNGIQQFLEKRDACVSGV